MDPVLTSDGKPYGPVRLAEIIEERYELCKHLKISYAESAKITPIERDYLFKFIKRDLDKENDLNEQLIQNMKKK